MIGRSGKDMVTLKDVPAEAFIKGYAEHLKKSQKIKPIKDANLLKTGHGREVTPENEDWYFVRAAAVARTLFLRPERGVGTLRHIFGKKGRPGFSNPHHSVASGKVLRHVLQQLQAADILMPYNDKRNKSFKAEDGDKTKYPRIITPSGHKDMNTIAKNVFESLYKTA